MIDSLFYKPMAQCINIESLVTQGELKKEEAIVFSKMMGLRNVVRNSFVNHEKQLSFLLERFFCEKKVNKEKIQFCFYAHTADDISSYENNVLFEVLKREHLENVNFMGVSLHKCASPFQLLYLSRKLFSSIRADEHILILISDIAFTKILQNIPGSTILSDGALALLLSKVSSSYVIQDIVIKEMPDFYQGIFSDKKTHLLFQESYVENVCMIIREIVLKNSLSLDDISAIFPHNVNTISWKMIADRLHFPMQKIFSKNIQNYAHQFGIDPFLNLYEGIQEHFIQKGDHYLLVSVGLGATFAVALMKY